MTEVWALASVWLGLALVASLLSVWFRISTALSEIPAGTAAQLIIGAAIGSCLLGELLVIRHLASYESADQELG